LKYSEMPTSGEAINTKLMSFVRGLPFFANSSAARQATMELIDSPITTTLPSVSRTAAVVCVTPSERALFEASGFCE